MGGRVEIARKSGEIGRRSGQIKRGVDQDNVTKDPDAFFIPPVAEEGDHLLKKDAVQKNTRSFFGIEFAAVFPKGGKDVLRQFSQLFLIGQTGKSRCSHKYIRVITINKIFHTASDFDAKRRIRIGVH
jgi:hypothetical protein